LVYALAVVAVVVVVMLTDNNNCHVVINASDIPTGASQAQASRSSTSLGDETGKDATEGTEGTDDGPYEVGTFKSIENDFEYDENNKLAYHYIVFPANRPDCHTATMHGTVPEIGFKAIAIEGDALKRVFPDYNKKKHKKKKVVKDDTTSSTSTSSTTTTEEDDEHYEPRCLAAVLGLGTDKSVTGYTMPMYHFEAAGPPVTPQDKNLFKNWFVQNIRKVEVCFINYVSKKLPLKVYWIEPSKVGLPRDDDFSKKYNQGSLITLEYGERKTNCFASFIGHEFEAYVVSTNKGEDGIDVDVVEFYEHFVIRHTTTKPFGTSPPSSSRKFENINAVEKEVKKALNTEWTKHKEVQRTFSSLGFARGRLPNDVFASMGSFYYNNRNHVSNEEWGGKGLFVNWWETDIKFVSIPWKLKQVWQLRLLTLVKEWSGVDVEETSMYGLRQYEQGARLLSHVDRLTTHAVSLIVNIEQENLASPWPVEVFDHADRLHEVMMEPGDIVYYESAKNLHGRNRPLTCKTGMNCKFVNLFTHYRPKADGDRWLYNLDDMPNRPSPLLQGQVNSDQDNTICAFNEDDANSDNNGINSVKGGGIGLGTINCNDSRLGSHVSPTLFKVTSGQDLFQWWQASADPNFIGYGHAKKIHEEVDVEVDNVDSSSASSGTPSLSNTAAATTTTTTTTTTPATATVNDGSCDEL